VGDRTADGDIALLTSLIRAPSDLLQALSQDEARTEELRAMGERVRLLSTTIDALLGQMEGGETAEKSSLAKPARKRTAATKRPSATPTRRTTG
jgi:hypothetical protein